jgi:hypothetical protein
LKERRKNDDKTSLARLHSVARDNLGPAVRFLCWRSAQPLCARFSVAGILALKPGGVRGSFQRVNLFLFSVSSGHRAEDLAVRQNWLLRRGLQRIFRLSVVKCNWTLISMSKNFFTRFEKSFR